MVLLLILFISVNFTITSPEKKHQFSVGADYPKGYFDESAHAFAKNLNRCPPVPCFQNYSLIVGTAGSIHDKNVILYQTEQKGHGMWKSHATIDKMKNAVAVWDFSPENILEYSDVIFFLP